MRAAAGMATPFLFLLSLLQVLTRHGVNSFPESHVKRRHLQTGFVTIPLTPAQLPPQLGQVPVIIHNTLHRVSQGPSPRNGLPSPFYNPEMEFTPSNISTTRILQRGSNWKTYQPKKKQPRLTDIPKAWADNIQDLLVKMLSTPRSDQQNQTHKNWVRKALTQKFEEYGAKTFHQNFTEIEPNELDNRVVIKGTNIIGILPGRNWGKRTDKILLIGAHYDTFLHSPGVNDNGSGVAVMLEVLRSLVASGCTFKHSVFFVAFDQEELGGLGSYYFVNTYLIPRILQEDRGTFQGAFVLDTVLNFNNSFHSQDMPRDFQTSEPTLRRYVAATQNTGDFLAIMSRRDIDTPLAERLQDSWRSMDKWRLKIMEMPVKLGAAIPTMPVIAAHMNFVRSDHAMFWYHNTTSYPSTLRAVLITDTGPFRGVMRKCYHMPCDNLNFVTAQNLQMAKKLGDALIKTLLELGDGNCTDPQSAPSTLYNEGSNVTLAIAACIVAAFLFIFNHNSP